jgi:hypothetical protein
VIIGCVRFVLFETSRDGSSSLANVFVVTVSASAFYISYTLDFSLVVFMSFVNFVLFKDFFHSKLMIAGKERN